MEHGARIGPKSFTRWLGDFNSMLAAYMLAKTWVISSLCGRCGTMCRLRPVLLEVHAPLTGNNAYMHELV